MKDWSEHLDLLIRSRTPLVWIRSSEEERLEVLLAQAAERLKPRRLASWDYIDGLQGVINSNGSWQRLRKAFTSIGEHTQPLRPDFSAN